MPSSQPLPGGSRTPDLGYLPCLTPPDLTALSDLGQNPGVQTPRALCSTPSLSLSWAQTPPPTNHPSDPPRARAKPRCPVTATHQEGVHPHVWGPARVSHAHGCQRAGVGVSTARAHQHSLQLRVLHPQLSQGLPDVTLQHVQPEVVPAPRVKTWQGLAQRLPELFASPAAGRTWEWPQSSLQPTHPNLWVVAWMNCSISGKGDGIRM